MVPILGPIKDPKITKYKDMVTAGGTNVCTQILRYLLISFLIRVINETRISFPLFIINFY
tara:strand:- start:3393 stop:3572 length:180 start_codon:yes stop_codon:yes gene_type:complete